MLPLIRRLHSRSYITYPLVSYKPTFQRCGAFDHCFRWGRCIGCLLRICIDGMVDFLQHLLALTSKDFYRFTCANNVQVYLHHEVPQGVAHPNRHRGPFRIFGTSPLLCLGRRVNNRNSCYFLDHRKRLRTSFLILMSHRNKYSHCYLAGKRLVLFVDVNSLGLGSPAC